MGWSRRLKADWTVLMSPSRRAFSSTWRVRSGRERALPTSDFSANSTTIRSVPAETRLAAVRTRAVPGRTDGAGTSATTALPSRKFCRSCFMDRLSHRGLRPPRAFCASGERPSKSIPYSPCYNLFAHFSTHPARATGVDMSDIRVQRFAKVLVEHSARVAPGDRILIEATTAAEPLVRELFAQILERGGLPHPMIAVPGMMPFSQDELWMTY